MRSTRKPFALDIIEGSENTTGEAALPRCLARKFSEPKLSGS
jgi:hypothetical protein